MADKQLWQVTPVANDVKNDDGVIIGGSTAGTRYAPLTLIANYVHNLWAAFINALTAVTSFSSGDNVVIVNGTTAKKMSKDELLFQATTSTSVFLRDLSYITNFREDDNIILTSILNGFRKMSKSNLLRITGENALQLAYSKIRDNTLWDYNGLYTDNKYIDADGVVQDSPVYPIGYYCVTDYIPVTEGETYVYMHLNVVGTLAYSAFYDASKNLVGTFKQTQGECEKLFIPSGVSYVRFSLIHNPPVLYVNFILWAGNSVEKNAAVIDSKVSVRNVAYGPNDTRTKKHYYLDSSGDEVENLTTPEYFCITDYIPVTEKTTRYYQYLNAAGSSPYSAFYDSSKNYISSFKQKQGDLIRLEIPSGVSYVRFSVMFDGSTTNFMFFDENVNYLTDMRLSRLENDNRPLEDIAPNYVVCINGDSVEGRDSAPPTTPYGHFATMLVNKYAWKSSSIIAIGGTAFTEGVDQNEKIGSQERVNRIPLDCSLIITGGATNDWGKHAAIGSLMTIDDPTTFCGALHQYFQRLNARVPNAVKVMVSNQFGACPNRWPDSHDPASGLWNNNNNCLLDFHVATKLVCDFDSVFYIPMYEECGINAFNYTTYCTHDTPGGVDVWVHPTTDGAKMMLSVVEKHLTEILAKK